MQGERRGRAASVVLRLKQLVDELSIHPGLVVVKAEVRERTEPQLLASAKAAMGALPVEVEEFYDACGGVHIEWRTSEPALRPRDRCERGLIQVPQICGNLGERWQIDVWDSEEAYVVFQKKDGTLQLRLENRSYPLPIDWLDYLDLAVSCRGLCKWPLLLLPTMDQDMRARMITVVRYLFADFDTSKFSGCATQQLESNNNA